ncbi:hypothetical protein BJ322DRAFT_1021599 [Thelephora terrestris]|uniref:Uncharacterized protein n=1 Tax=Thelephora terrestris TaxID=56493 RepID=A0A9P6HBX5_9AGAM|nr:hypothetical protein BJ322DRAFT_1021599 [Thelephora terrestris]
MSTSKRKAKPIIHRHIPVVPSAAVKTQEFKRSSQSRLTSTTSRSSVPLVPQIAREPPDDLTGNQLYSDEPLQRFFLHGSWACNVVQRYWYPMGHGLYNAIDSPWVMGCTTLLNPHGSWVVQEHGLYRSFCSPWGMGHMPVPGKVIFD